MNKKNLRAFGIVAAGLLILGGCSHTTNPEVGDLEKQIREKDREIADLSASNQEKAKTIENYNMEQKGQAGAQTTPSTGGTADISMFPPNAKPGECWARVFVPPTYRIRSESVLKKDVSERLEVIPAKYKLVEEKVLVKEASERIEIIPAQYEWVEERVLVEAASSKLVEVPVKYAWQEERVLVKPAHTVWKKGHGPIEKVDNITGEIMCLVEVPATYKTVKKRVVVSPPSTKEIAVPAKYQTVKKRVMVKAPQERRIAIPAEYKSVKVRKLISPPSERRIEIPAEYQTVKHTEQASEGHMEWRRILCETNVTPRTIAKVQSALAKAGYNPGSIDGELGSQTQTALRSFQRDHNLATGGLTYETMKRLGVSL